MKTLLKSKELYIFMFIFLSISLFTISKTDLFFNEDFFIKQIIWYLIGFFIIYLINKVDIKKIYNLSFFFYLTNIFLLFILLLLGSTVNGSKSWFLIGNISIQPSEFMKICLIIFNSYIIHRFYKNREKISTKKEFILIITLLLTLAIPSILTFMQPDTGAVIGYFIITFSMLFASGINKNWFIFFFLLFLIFIIFFFVLFFIKQDLFINIFGTNFFYRIERIINWQNKSGMQLNNSLISIGSSGFFGHGKIPLYYPESETDFIFTSLISVSGLLGGIFLIITFLLFDLYILKIIKYSDNKENQYTLFGIISLLIYQQIEGISMTIGLLPIIGITLPFISYGGSSIISSLILIGIIININKKRPISRS